MINFLNSTCSNLLNFDFSIGINSIAFWWSFWNCGIWLSFVFEWTLYCCFIQKFLSRYGSFSLLESFTSFMSRLIIKDFNSLIEPLLLISHEFQSLGAQLPKLVIISNIFSLNFHRGGILALFPTMFTIYSSIRVWWSKFCARIIAILIIKIEITKLLSTFEFFFPVALPWWEWPISGWMLMSILDCSKSLNLRGHCWRWLNHCIRKGLDL